MTATTNTWSWSSVNYLRSAPVDPSFPATQLLGLRRREEVTAFRRSLPSGPVPLDHTFLERPVDLDAGGTIFAPELDSSIRHACTASSPVADDVLERPHPR